MAMQVGGKKGGPKSDINITPLIDIVLVLLIIFMVLTPITQMGYDVRTPPKLEKLVAPPSADQIIVRMDRDGRIYINKDLIPAAQFPAKLQQVMQNRNAKIAFFAADGDLPWDKVAQFLDTCRDNGADNLGIVFDDLSPTT